MFPTIFTIILALSIIPQCILASNSLKLKIVNYADEPIEIFWVNTFAPSRDFVAQTKKPLRNNSETIINTYESHQFAIRFLHDSPENDAIFVKGSGEETIKVFQDYNTKNLYYQVNTPYTELSELIGKSTDLCISSGEGNLSLVECISSKVNDEFNKIKQRKEKLIEYRDKMSRKLRNYTCEDPMMETTKPVRSYEYKFLGKNYNIEVLLDMPRSKIWMIKDFVEDFECNELMNYGKPRLTRATVADDDGTSILSESRKANQAGYILDVQNPRSDILWPLYDRIINVINYHSEYNILPEGQEGYTIIQYNPGDEYISHCDGSCEGQEYFLKGRVATAVLYCAAPNKGGATSFTNADIFVNPLPKAAVFFSYKGKDNIMDEGFTDHSGCPVFEGEKWIAATWFREGLSKTDTWDSYDPEGRLIPILDLPVSSANEQRTSSSNDEL